MYLIGNVKQNSAHIYLFRLVNTTVYKFEVININFNVSSAKNILFSVTFAMIALGVIYLNIQ
jgi:hypothetical protein